MTTSIASSLRKTALALGLGALSLAGLAQDNNSIVVYNAQHVSLTQAWANGFTQETGIKVILRNGSDTELGNQIVQEGAASPADVFLTENSPAMALVDANGLLAPVAPGTITQVAANYRPAHSRWIGIAARSTVFVYDKRKLSTAQLPHSLLDLAKPEWKGRWAASPAGADFQAIVSAMLELKGETTTLQWLKAMKENAMLYKGNGVAMKAVNAGQVEGAVIYHYYRFGDQAKTGENSNNTALHYFRNEDPGAFVSIDGEGRLRVERGFVRRIDGGRVDAFVVQGGGRAEGLAAARMDQERRPLRLLPKGLSWRWIDEQALELSFELPAGAYATVVMQIPLMNV